MGDSIARQSVHHLHDFAVNGVIVAAHVNDAHEIVADGFGITDKCRRYLLPLIQGEDYPKYKAGLPAYVTLKNVAVAKKLPSFELK